jgi:hypothetical protein
LGGGVTAEIAILNRSAVALAADSAVTLGIAGQEKIYNSVDKLFQLCLNEPVGIMIFGGAEYMGVPIETVIKKFRDSEFSAPKQKLQEYSTAFFAFLETEISVPTEVGEEHLLVSLSDSFALLYRDAFTSFVMAAQSDGKIDRKRVPQYMAEQISALVAKRVAELEEKNDCSFINIDPEHVWFKDLFQKVIDQTMKIELPESTTAQLSRLAYLLLQKDVYSRGAMGLVFAGFGVGELFPKLEAFHSDGLVNGRVKRQQFRYVDIHRTGDGSGARIEAFAQKEMVERFLDGIDPDYEDYLRSAMHEALGDMGKHVSTSFLKTSKKKRQVIEQTIVEAAEKYLAEFEKKAKERKETNFRQKILDMVNFMPKSDLANMAESLINLTSTKRRVSAESETVGGPIDVAVISKYDGFVWIKRKHYFEKELNPRYFVAQQQRSQTKEAKRD